MKSAGRGRWLAGALFLLAMCALIVLSIAARRHWRTAITADDIPIITGWFAVASTTLAYLSAQASRAAADDSRKALLLHFRPEDIRAAFSVRDPGDPNAQMGWTPVASPAPLYLTLSALGQEPAEQYTVVWVDDSGAAVAPREVVLTPGREKHILLDGVAAEEDDSGPTRQTVAALTRLTVECRDGQMKSKWVCTMRWPQRGPLGSYRLEFELAD
jgi:hypothetical protein